MFGRPSIAQQALMGTSGVAVVQEMGQLILVIYNGATSLEVSPHANASVTND